MSLAHLPNVGLNKQDTMRKQMLQTTFGKLMKMKFTLETDQHRFSVKKDVFFCCHAHSKLFSA